MTPGIARTQSEERRAVAGDLDGAGRREALLGCAAADARQGEALVNLGLAELRVVVGVREVVPDLERLPAGRRELGHVQAAHGLDAQLERAGPGLRHGHLERPWRVLFRRHGLHNGQCEAGVALLLQSRVRHRLHGWLDGVDPGFSDGGLGVAGHRRAHPGDGVDARDERVGAVAARDGALMLRRVAEQRHLVAEAGQFQAPLEGRRGTGVSEVSPAVGRPYGVGVAAVGAVRRDLTGRRDGGRRGEHHRRDDGERRGRHDCRGDRADRPPPVAGLLAGLDRLERRGGFRGCARRRWRRRRGRGGQTSRGSSRSRGARAARARARRDFTVPAGTPSASAIWSVSRPRRCRTTTARCARGSAASARSASMAAAVGPGRQAAGRAQRGLEAVEGLAAAVADLAERDVADPRLRVVVAGDLGQTPMSRTNASWTASSASCRSRQTAPTCPTSRA